MQKQQQQPGTIKLCFRDKRIKVRSPIRYTHLLQGVDRLLADFRQQEQGGEEAHVIVQLFAGKYRYEITKQSDWDDIAARYSAMQVLEIQVEVTNAHSRQRRYVRDEDADSYSCLDMGPTPPPPQPQPAPEPAPATLPLCWTVQSLRAMAKLVLEDDVVAEELSAAMAKLMMGEHAALASKLLSAGGEAATASKSL